MKASLRPSYTIIINLLLISNLSSVSAADNIFSKIIHSTDDNTVDQCVKAINTTADDGLNAAARTYHMGMCHFCVDCNYEVDNGQLFLVDHFDSNAFDEVLSSKKYKIAHKLISQAAVLGHRDAYYSLAVMLYVKDLGQSRQYESSALENEGGSLLQVNNNIGELEKNYQGSIGVLFKDALEKSNDNSFNHQIHKYLLIAAKQGYMPAQFALSEVYFKGIGVPPDDVRAYAWASVAVAQNPPFGSLRRDEKAINFDNVKLNKAEALAEEYTKKYSNIFESSSVTEIY